ncbi:NAD(P)H-dependent nitrite reductase flavoprotein subunit [Rhizobiales bacterium GAS191]|nr:NAD(P)H-dependent nitrite reductase flavoprotein subunit [Rhizobiales bacterium GAS191]
MPVGTLLIPEGAPFTPEQRGWLSGFLAAVLSAPPTASPAASGDAAPPAPGRPVLASNDEAPWHDPAMAIAERMQLADGKPLAPRLMAAMAQQDCGQCGYNCADYANALFGRKEERLNLCAPGGKETQRMLKALAVELSAPGDGKALADMKALAPSVGGNLGAALESLPAAADLGQRGRSRELPVEAEFLGRRLLNAPGSEKETWHVEFDLAESGIDYEVGDSFGIFPRNDLGLVDQVIAMLGASPEMEIRGRKLRRILHEEISLGQAPDALFELFSYVSGGAVRLKAKALARGEDPDGDAASLDVLATLLKFPQVRPHAEALVETLEPLQPRLYSISSSPKHEAGRLALTVDAVRYVMGKRRRLGVASTYLAERIDAGGRAKVFVQKAQHFALPVDPAKPVIMIGPGTGIAPFRAFLQERAAIGASGRNWLFFGHQRQDYDFFYRDELHALRKRGVLTRLSLAWSRDGSEKYYVQDRMREVGAELWRWLAEGAHVYVCGDAKRMARDVEAALVDIVAEHGVRSLDEAVAFVQGLKRAERYQADVY